MSTFSCQCQNYRGSLVVTEREFYFTSSLFRIELEWGNVKRVRLETKQVKGVHTSVLVVVLHHSEAIRLLSTTNASQKKRGSASRKFFFYGFQDLLGAEELVKHNLELYRASEKAREKERREETDKGSSAATKRPEKATEKDEVTSSETEAVKEDSLNMSRLAIPRRPESEPTRAVAPLSFAGRRATASTFSRPKIPVKLPIAAPPTAEAERHNRIARVFLRVYRHVAALLVVVLLLQLSRYVARPAPARDGRYATQYAERLIHEIDALASVTAALESYDSQESLWRYRRGQKRLVELSHGYTRQLEQTAVELMERYVSIQAKMTTLRGQRATRVARAEQSGTSAPPPPSMSSDFSTPKTATTAGGSATASAATSGAFTGPSLVSKAPPRSASSKEGSCAASGTCKKPTSAAKTPFATKRMSLSRLRADIQRWVRRGTAVWDFVVRFSRGAQEDAAFFPSTATADPRSSADGGWVMYSEELGDSFHVTEWVASAEDEDRHKCLQLSKDLVDTVELTERVFATFTSIFLVDRYRQLVSGEERGAYWLQPPQALRAVANGQKSMAKKAFSGGSMARMALLRRFVASLVHNEPLIANQAHRRAAALRIAAALASYRQEEVALRRTRNRGHTDNTTVLWKVLSEMVVARSTRPLADDPSISDGATFLRNPIEELRFWRAHESAWREHVLTFFTPAEQADIRSTFRSNRSAGEGEDQPLEDLGTQPAALYWRHLPLFRGLLCFEVIPQLDEAEQRCEATGVKVVDEEETDSASANTEESDTVGDKEEKGDEEDAPLPAARPSSTTNVLSAPSLTRATTTPKLATARETEAPAADSATPRPVFAGGNPTPASSTTLWKEVKLRWMADLETFRLAFDSNLARRTAQAVRSYRLDVEDRSIVADAAEVRRRLFSLLEVVNEDYVRYISPLFVQRVGSCLRSLFLPYSSASSGSDVYVAALQKWGTQDPAVQLATAQVTGMAPGTTQDVSGSLLYLILQPPSLLQTSMLSVRKTVAAVLVLVLFVVVLTVLHFMQ